MVFIVDILCYSAIKCAIITKFGTRIDCNVIYKTVYKLDLVKKLAFINYANLCVN